MALLSAHRENSGSSTRTRTVHIFDGRGDVGKIVRSSPLETLSDSSPCLRTALANHFRIRKTRIDVKHLGDPPRASTYAVLKDQHDEDIAYLFLAGVDETQLVLLAITRRKSAEDIYRLIRDFPSSVCSRQLRLLREGQALESGTLSDLDIRSLTVLQVVEVETKKMNVIYYQCGDVRKKFHPEVFTTATTREIKLALRQEVSASNLKHLESHELIVSVGERVLDDDFQPHIDVLCVDGRIKSRRLNDKYYIIQSFPNDVPRIIIPFKYRRAMDKKAKERGAIIIVSPDASMKTVRDNIARFVSKPGNSLRLCGTREEPLQLSSLDSASVLQKTSLYAQPEPAKTVFVVVRATPSGQETSIRARLYNWDTVSDLKKVVAEEMKTHPELLCLEYGQQTLEEHDYLDAYRLQDRSTVQCRWYQPGVVITLYACRCSWHRIFVHDATRTTVGELQRWQQTLLQASSRVTLVQHGRPLDSDLCLAEAGIAFGARLRVICPEPVNAVEQPPPSCERAFQTAESGCTEERFLSFPVKNKKPFYAQRGTKLADLAMKENRRPGDSSCTGMNAENAVVEGIHLLDESDGLCASRRRTSNIPTSDQTAKEDLSIWRNQSLFEDTTRQCDDERALARSRSSSVHSETRRPFTLRDAKRFASCMDPRGQYQETTRKPQAQRFLDDEGPNGRERQPEPRQLASSGDVGANVLGRDTFRTALSTNTTTDGRLSGNIVKESASDQITATHIHSPYTTDDEETERKYLCDDSQLQCRSEPLHSADTQVHQKQLPHPDIVAPDPLNGITDEKRLDSGFATSNHAARLLSSSDCQRAAATEKEPSASAEMPDMDTPKSLHSRSVLKATNQLNGARTSQGRSGTHANGNSQFSVFARHGADVCCHGALCQGCLSPTNAGEMKDNTAETKGQEETTTATITTAICDSQNLLYEEKIERKSAACSSQVQSPGGLHDVTNVQVCKEQRELEQNLTHSVPNVRAQEASTARESATQPHPQTSRPEITKPPPALHELDLSLDFPEFLLETQPGCGGDGLVEENPSPTLASEASSCSSLGTNEGHQTADQRQRKQVLHESRIRAAGKRQDLKRDATEMCSFVDDKTPQTLSDSPNEQTVATHHLGQGSTAQAAGSEGHDQTRVYRTRRKTIQCTYESSKPNRRAPKRRSKTMTQVSLYVEEEEIVCHLGGHSLDASPSKQKQLQATGSAKHTSDGDIIVWEEIFNCVADELVGEWPKIGIELGVPYKDIDAIKHKHHPNLFDAAFECLMKWRQMKGSGATAEKLQRALEAKGFRNIVETLSQKFPSVFCLYEESK